MKGKHLVIGLVLFIILAVTAIYFTMKATINHMENGMAPIVTIVEMMDEVDYR
ncbi:hypothetical protein [Sporosarcina sp. JAI121]|uniref:hypothetical protein n=1 Tax=Sporosarcina sp. JAI121 TaxID=2723064 RepID=UPI0015CE41D8|nr:hypothetical protein [Sporosarcina sp. JAI121]NYF25863.1 hypothetical protein [Sporosarcina sp. JAI121]